MLMSILSIPWICTSINNLVVGYIVVMVYTITLILIPFYLFIFIDITDGIIDYKWEKGNYIYYVCWKGYEEEDDT